MNTCPDEIIEDFLLDRIDATTFVDRYFEYRRENQNSREASIQLPIESDVHGTVFCLADLYNPDKEKKEYELDSLQLKAEIEKWLRLFEQ